MPSNDSANDPTRQTEARSTTVMQDELHQVARKARKTAGLTQKAAAERLGVSRPNISKAESDPSGRYLSLQRRMIEELAGWGLRGPLWEVTQPWMSS